MTNSSSKHLIIGMGEVGKSLFNVFDKGGLDVRGIDKEFDPLADWAQPYADFDFLHICIPYSEQFIEIVKEHERGWRKRNGITVIHSTVPVGTSRELDAVHSPIHGVHPNLEQSIRTFVKYIGATNRAKAEQVLGEFQKVGIKGLIVKNPETSELSKLGCTRRHGLMIIEEKEFHEDCEKYGADFGEAYALWNRFYGIGYEELGMPYIRRAIVRHQDGPIGGHCIVANLDLLPGAVSDFVKERNVIIKGKSG